MLMPAVLQAPRVFPGHFELPIEGGSLEILELERAGFAWAERLSGNML